jgi:Mycoplasma protein of unknown function, DUF285
MYSIMHLLLNMFAGAEKFDFILLDGDDEYTNNYENNNDFSSEVESENIYEEYDETLYDNSVKIVGNESSNFTSGKRDIVWDTSNVNDMISMFQNATSLNEIRFDWNVSKVTFMDSMFFGATSFNGAGIENWDTSKVVSMISMFSYASAFNGYVDWDVTNVKNTQNYSWVQHHFLEKESANGILAIV